MKDSNGEEIPESRSVFVGYLSVVAGVLLGLYSIAWPIYVLKDGQEVEVFMHWHCMFLSFFLPILGFGLIIFKSKVWDVFPTENNEQVKWWQLLIIILIVVAIVFTQEAVFSYLETLGLKIEGI